MDFGGFWEPRTAPKSNFWPTFLSVGFRTRFLTANNANISVSPRREHDFQGSPGSRKWSKMSSKINQMRGAFLYEKSILFRKGSLRRFLGRFGLHFATPLVDLGSIRAPFWSICVPFMFHFGTLLVALGSILAHCCFISVLMGTLQSTCKNKTPTPPSKEMFLWTQTYPTWPGARTCSRQLR